jgi:hypothetical protein
MECRQPKLVLQAGMNIKAKEPVERSEAGFLFIPPPTRITGGTPATGEMISYLRFKIDC